MSILLCALFFASTLSNETLSKHHQVKNRRFYIDYDKNTFMMDDKPFRYIAGSLHYFRVHPQQWKDRLEKLKAAGLNAVDTYVEWSLHNFDEGKYWWGSNADLEQFIKTAQEVGLYVILRPGPYICAERDFGGQPYWLLSHPEKDIKPRTTDFRYMEAARDWIQELFKKIRPYLYGNGGPIIMVQVENEYGSFGCDPNYRNFMYGLFEDEVENNAVLFTTDGYWDDMPICGRMGEAYATVDFGPGDDVEEAWKVMRKVSPKGPLVNSEYYTGWLTHWGGKPAEVSPSDVAKTLRKILAQNASVSMYMFAGGTNFEYSNGANFENDTYLPQITSYDYDAPLNEAGDPTPKYMAIKEVISEFVDIPDVKPVTIAPKGKYGTFKLKPGFSLFDKKHHLMFEHPLHDVEPLTFEHLYQASGFIIYFTFLNEDMTGQFSAPNLKDRALIYVDEVYKGTLDRRLKQFSLQMSAKKGAELKIIVENLGRINYGPIAAEYKGLNKGVEWGGKTFTSWYHHQVPATEFRSIEDHELGIGDRVATRNLTNGPIMYGTEFELPKGVDGIVRDTFLDMTNWGKGVAWINGINVGRYWPSVGPQITLYVPKYFLKPEKNRIDILELEYANPDLTIIFADAHKFSTNIASFSKACVSSIICVLLISLKLI